MTLKEYLKLKNIGLGEFAMKSGYSYSYVTDIYNGKYVGKGAALTIEKMTGGLVNAQELLKNRTEKS